VLCALLGAWSCAPSITNDRDTATVDARVVRDAEDTDAGAALPDAESLDTGIADAAFGDVPPSDVTLTGHPCSTERLINLNSAGTRVGARRIRYLGSNARTPAQSAFNPFFTCSHPAHEVAFSYVARLYTRLRVSTNNPGTAANFNTIVFAMSDPEPPFPTPPTECNRWAPAGCNDDVWPRDIGSRSRASTLVTTSAAWAGATVVIVVAGYTPASAGFVDTGEFELTVDEINVPVDGACDPGISVCARGSMCVTNGATSTCVADGASGGACRRGPLGCDAGLGCSSALVCRPAVGPGDACDPMRVTNVCASGSSCATNDVRFTCVADGANGGTCRATAPACDMDLGCTRARVCRPTVPNGATCDPTGTTNICAIGSNCVVSGATNVCVPDGFSGGRCRVSASACDTGLTCSELPENIGARCRTSVGPGEPCDPTVTMNACVSPTSCVTTGASSTCATVGYVEAALPTPTFLDACGTGGMRVMLEGTSRDDVHATGAVAIPFSFEFFRVAQGQIWPSSNGYAVFGTTPPADVFAGAIPLRDESAVVAPYLDDLVVRASPSSDLCTRTFGTTPNRQFVVEWLDAYRRPDATTHLTFELVLHEGTHAVDFVYQTLTGVDAGRPAVGLQNATGLRTAVHSGTISTAVGIRWTPLP